MYEPFTVETDKDRIYEAAVCEVKGTGGASLKHFQLDCFKTDGVCAFDMPFQCMHAKPQCKLKPECVDQLQGTSKRCDPAALFIIFLKSIYDKCCKPIIPSLRMQNNNQNV